MKRIKTLLFIAFCAISISSCKKKDADLPPALRFGVVTPVTAFSGETVQIVGENFGNDINAISVKFGTSSAVAPVSLEYGLIVVKVPEDATTGKIQITVNGRTVTSPDVFVVPERTTVSITDFSPKLARPDNKVTITGSGFGTDPSLVQVWTGDYAYNSIVSISPNTIVFETNKYTPSGKIKVTRGGNSAISANAFKALPFEPPYLPLEIASYTTHAKVGQSVSIYGSGFGNVKEFISISFGGSPGVQPDYLSATGLTMQVYNLPANAKSGKITVTVEGKSVTGTDTFTVDK